MRFAWLVLSAGLACQNRAAPPGDAGPTEPSPNASILPAPLATGLEQAQAEPRDGSPGDADANAEIALLEWEREDRAPADDLSLREELAGMVLTTRFHWPAVAVPPRLPESNPDGLARLREKGAFLATIELAGSGRMRFVLASQSFALPQDTELRARADRFGHVIVWPNRRRYGVAQPGSLSAVLNERRLDTQPLASPKSAPLRAGHALGFDTELVRFSTPFGKLELEQANVAGAGAGGLLLCRMLLELAGLHPDAAACAPELVPVRAEYVAAGPGRLVFEVTNVQRGVTFDPELLAFPPRDAEHRIGELPEPASPLIASRDELRAVRAKPLPSEGRDAGAPKDGLLVVNAGSFAGYLLLDGVPVVRLRARAQEVLLDLLPGSYQLQTQDFLGRELGAPSVVQVPARYVVSEVPKVGP